MKQNELLELIGLKSTDQKLVNYFEKFNLGKPPKTINANQMRKSIEYKPLNFSFGFEYHITNDHFQPPISPKNDDYNFVAYLSSIDFFSKTVSAKKPDPKTEDFWDVSPNPIISIEDFKKISRSDIESDENFLSITKSLDNDKKLWLTYDVKNKMITQCFARIKTHSEIISHVFFDNNSAITGKTVHLNAMLIKWLFENNYLLLDENVYEKQLKNNTDDMLSFIQTHLKNHLWDNQITDTKFLRNFLFTTHQNNWGLMNENGEKIMFYFRDIFLKSVGKFGLFEKLYVESFEKAELFIGEISFDDENYKKFSMAMTENFDLYKKLKALEINKY